jgi:hypothetical protein
MKKKKYLRVIEFLVVGVAMGLIEDLIAVRLATDASIDWQVVWVVLLVAIPFAFISEVVVDHPKFWELFFGGDGK